MADGNYVNGDLPMHEMTPDEIEAQNERHERACERCEREKKQWAREDEARERAAFMLRVREASL